MRVLWHVESHDSFSCGMGWCCFITYSSESFCIVVTVYNAKHKKKILVSLFSFKTYNDEMLESTQSHIKPWLTIFSICLISRFRGMSFPLPTRWEQRLEPRLPSHFPCKAPKGPQWHSDRGTPFFLWSSGGEPTSAFSASPNDTHPHLMSQLSAPEEAATLCQVGKQSICCAKA